MNKILLTFLLYALAIGPILGIGFARGVADSYYREDGSLFYIGNEHIEIGFRRNNGALWCIVHKESGVNLRKERVGSWQLTWGLTMLTRSLEHIYTDNSCSSSFRYSIEKISNGTEAALTWGGVKFKDGRDCPTQISVRVSVYNNSPLTVWAATVRNLGPMAVEKLTLPLIAGIEELGNDGNDDCLAVPDREGRLFHAPSANLSDAGGCYPSCFLNMQFMAFYDNSCGFYFATHDTQGNVKEFTWWKPKEAGAVLSIQHYSDIRFGDDFTLPYNVVVGVFSGDWFTAAEIYKQWASDQRWAERKLRERDTPSWVAEIGVSSLFTSRAPWQKIKTLREITTLARNHREYFGVPILVELWGWENKGAWSWGDYFPPSEGWEEFDKMVEDLHGAGCKLKIFIGMVSVNTATELWKSKEPLSYTVRNESSSIIQPAWDPHFDQALMCIGTSYWQKQLEEIVLTMVRHGVDMIQFDGFPPDPRTFACYDADHGHPLGAGGNWLPSAWLKTVSAIVSKAREINTDVAFTAEGITEIHIPYINVAKYWRDVYAEFGYNDQKLQTGVAEIIPLFNYVYHEYILCMGEYLLGLWSHLRHNQYNAFCISRMLSWGEIPLINAQLDPNSPQAEKDSLDMTARLAKARRTYAKDFLVYGQMQPSRLKVPITTVPFHPDPSAYGNISFDVETPSVLQSVWKAPDGSLGYVLTNIGDKRISCQIDLTAYVQLFGKMPCAFYRIVDGDLSIIFTHSNAPSSVEISIDPRQIAVLVLTQAEGPRGKTIESISKAVSAIDNAESENRTLGLSNAETLLYEAIRFFTQGDFARSQDIAQNAEAIADTAQRARKESPTQATPLKGTVYVSLVIVIAAIILVAVVCKFRRGRRPSLSLN